MVSGYKAIAAAIAMLIKSGALVQEGPFKAIGQMTGTDTAVEQARVQLIADQPAWAALWREHRSIVQINVPRGAPAQVTAEDSDRPKVDFKEQMVLCLFGGASRNVGGFGIAQVGSDGDSAYVRVQPLLLPASGAGLQQNPYLFITIPRTKRRIVVQLDQSALGGQGWRTLATLDPPK